jgi:hypothetical protein
MNQDFSKKIVIVVREDLPSWQVLNTVAHISAYLGNRIKENFDTGGFFLTKDGQSLPRNSQYAIVVLSAKASQLPAFVQEVRKSGLPHLGFIREMIETTNDTEIEQLLAQKEEKDLEYLGMGIFGDIEQTKALTKKFSLWK